MCCLRLTAAVVAALTACGGRPMADRAPSPDAGRSEAAASSADPPHGSTTERAATQATQHEADRMAEARSAQLRAALEQAERAFGSDSPQVLSVVLPLAGSELMRGRFDEAERLARRGVRLCSATPELAPACSSPVRTLLAGSLQARGDYAGAEHELFAALASLPERATAVERSRVSGQLAALLREQGDFDRAQAVLRANYERTLGEAGRTSLTLATIGHELAITELARGDVEAAEPRLREVIESLQAAMDTSQQRRPPAVAKVLGTARTTLAYARRIRGDLAEAESLLRSALELSLATFGPSSKETARARAQLGVLIAKRGKLSEAEPLLLESYSLYDEALPTAHPLRIMPALHLGEHFLHGKGDASTAEPWFRRAVDVGRRAAWPRLAQALTGLAWSLELQGKDAEADGLYRDAVETAEAQLGPLHPLTLSSLDDHSRSLVASHRLEDAIAVRAEIARRTEQLLEHAIGAGSDRQRRLLVARADLRRAQHATLSLHLRDAPDSAAAYELAYETLLHFKGRALEASVDALRALRRSDSGADARLLNELTRKRAALATLTFRGPAAKQPPSDFAGVCARLSEEIEQLDQQLGAGFERARRSRGAITVHRVEQALPADSALIEYVVYRRFDARLVPGVEATPWSEPVYAAYALTPSGSRIALELGPVAEIDELVRSLRARIEAGDDDWQEVARTLYRRLLLPLRGALGHARSLYIAPDAALSLLPFAALLTEDGEPLLASHRLTYLTSGRDILTFASDRPAGPRTALVVGAPAYDARIGAPSHASASESLSKMGRFPPLPGTLLESKSLVASLPNAMLWTGEAATEKAFKTIRGRSLVHMATHGFFLAPAPDANDDAQEDDSSADEAGELRAPALPADPLLQTGLVLAGANRRSSGAGEDGLLTALELTTVDLDGTELVTLSACQTALGEVRDGEGVLGLRRALQLAGSGAQLLTLWRVADAPTRQLMSDYYARLSRGEGRSEGMRQAQLAMRAEPRRAHPYFWAGFALSGNGDPLSAIRH